MDVELMTLKSMHWMDVEINKPEIYDLVGYRTSWSKIYEIGGSKMPEIQNLQIGWMKDDENLKSMNWMEVGCWKFEIYKLGGFVI